MKRLTNSELGALLNSAAGQLEYLSEALTNLSEGTDEEHDSAEERAVIKRLELAVGYYMSAEEQQAPFQSRVEPWLIECFGEMIAGDREERNHRFLEEALELVQACGCGYGAALKLVDYVYSRIEGEPHQEVGGVMVTLAALCLAQGLEMHECAETELARILQPEKVIAIREKQKRKPARSPLPGAYPERQP